MSASSNNNNFSKGTDLAVILLYLIMVAIGIMCIFMVEYNPNLTWSNSFLTAKTNYSKEYILMLSNIEEGLSKEKAEINLDDYLINLITYL